MRGRRGWRGQFDGLGKIHPNEFAGDGYFSVLQSHNFAMVSDHHAHGAGVSDGRGGVGDGGEVRASLARSIIRESKN